MSPLALYRLIQPFRATEAQMPWAYSKSNPDGRTLSDDWGLVGMLGFLQPWQKIPRQLRAYRIPLPLKQTKGKGHQEWVLWDQDYPTARGTIIKTMEYRTVNGVFMLPHALVDVAEDDGFATFAAWLNGEWVDVFHRYHKKIPLTNKTLKVCYGVRQDITVSPPETLNGKIRSDMMAWFPEFGCTLV